MLNFVQFLQTLIKNEDTTSFLAAKCHSILLGGILLLVATLIGTPMFFGKPINCKTSSDAPEGIDDHCLTSTLYIIDENSDFPRYSIHKWQLGVFFNFELFD